MKNTVKILALISAIILSASCNTKENIPDPEPDPNQGGEVVSSHIYRNPVISYSAPDPSWIKVDDTFYLYATEDIRGIPIFKSIDFINWVDTGKRVFPSESGRPTFIPSHYEGCLWAPDINYIDGQYVLYYVQGGTADSGIGVATASSPEGPWNNHGMVISNSSLGVAGCIDPEFVSADGKNYLFFGSFSHIYAIELTANGLGRAAGTPLHTVAGSAYEAPYVYNKDGYYYLFASAGYWGSDYKADNPYRVVVGRSKSVLGEYVDKHGNRMLDSQRAWGMSYANPGHELVIRDGHGYSATGHNGEIMTDKNGNDWIVYHAEKTLGAARTVMLDKLNWVDGWPIINSNGICSTDLHDGPVVR